MKKVGSTLALTATDLVGYLNCHHLTALDRAVAEGSISQPKVWDPLLEILYERGAPHEQSYVDHLMKAGLEVVRIDSIEVTEGAVGETLAAMRRGVPVIAQGALARQGWNGRADILRRIEVPSRLGGWSYEPIDTKLARETRAGTVVEARAAGTGGFELLPVEPGFGFTRLPEPSDGDVFLDLEGDPFVGEHGLEYLFGYQFKDPQGAAVYEGAWAFTRADEKRVFETFVDFVMERWEQFPGLHIYHYAPYEPAALKRLMGRYATREEEIDRMLRAGLFVDLYQIVRHGLRASVESYSIKQLEPFYGFERAAPLADANTKTH